MSGDVLDRDGDRWVEVGPDQWTCTDAPPGPGLPSRAVIDEKYGPLTPAWMGP